MSEIRRAKLGDEEAILKLLVQVDMVHHIARPDLFNGPATKYSKEELIAMFEDDLSPIYVFVGDDGEIIGHLFAQYKQVLNDSVLTDVKSMYIDDICVDEDNRGKHVGKSLYEYAIETAKANGCYNVTLNVWEGNDAAKAFYVNQGMGVQKTCMEVIL